MLEQAPNRLPDDAELTQIVERADRKEVEALLSRREILENRADAEESLDIRGAKTAAIIAEREEIINFVTDLNNSTEERVAKLKENLAKEDKRMSEGSVLDNTQNKAQAAAKKEIRDKMSEHVVGKHLVGFFDAMTSDDQEKSMGQKFLSSFFGTEGKAILVSILGFFGIKGAKDFFDGDYSAFQTSDIKKPDVDVPSIDVPDVDLTTSAGEEGGDESVNDSTEGDLELTEQAIDKRKKGYLTVSYKMLEQFAGESFETNKTLGQVVETVNTKNYVEIQNGYGQYMESSKTEADIALLFQTAGLGEKYGSEKIETKEKIISALDALVGVNANLMIEGQLGGERFSNIINDPKFSQRFGEEFSAELKEKGLNDLSVAEVLTLFSYSLPGKMLATAIDGGEFLKESLFKGVDFGKDVLADLTEDRNDLLSEELSYKLLNAPKDSSDILGDSTKYRAGILGTEGEELEERDLEKLDKFILFKDEFFASIKQNTHMNGFEGFADKFDAGINANKLIVAFLAFDGEANIDLYTPLQKFSLCYWLADVLPANEHRAFLTYLLKKLGESIDGADGMFSEQESYFIASNLIRQSREIFDIFLSPGSWGRNIMRSTAEGTVGAESLSEYETGMILAVIGLPLAAAGSTVFGPFVRIAMGGISLYGVNMLIAKLNDEGVLGKALTEGTGLDEHERDLLREIVEENNVTVKYS